ncbi:hypothetical protein H2248_005340 [Termitomyces sp. 'cryptogamus']|nr:hypothetical protein H2248_005340 [Termitomyces sp. 'cryptogamus']
MEMKVLDVKEWKGKVLAGSAGAVLAESVDADNTGGTSSVGDRRHDWYLFHHAFEEHVHVSGQNTRWLLARLTLVDKYCDSHVVFYCVSSASSCRTNDSHPFSFCQNSVVARIFVIEKMHDTHRANDQLGLATTIPEAFLYVLRSCVKIGRSDAINGNTVQLPLGKSVEIIVDRAM